MGGDPWISTRDLPKKLVGPITVAVRLKSTEKGIGLLYFGEIVAQGFHKERSVAFDLVHDGEFHDYEINLPVETITALRLDPGNGPAAMAITAFDLLDTTGQRESLLRATKP